MAIRFNPASHPRMVRRIALIFSFKMVSTASMRQLWRWRTRWVNFNNPRGRLFIGSLALGTMETKMETSVDGAGPTVVASRTKSASRLAQTAREHRLEAPAETSAASVTMTLPMIVSKIALEHLVVQRAKNACGTCDEDPTNDCPSENVTIRFTPDSTIYYTESSWTVTDAAGEIVESGAPTSGDAYVSFDLPFGEYCLNVFDSYGDGGLASVVNVGSQDAVELPFDSGSEVNYCASSLDKLKTAMANSR